MFADRLGKSKSWVDKVERGVRRLDKYSTIAEIALVLQVEVAELTGGREQPRRPEGGSPAVGQGEVDDIRAALERYDTLRPFSMAGGECTMPLSELCKSVDHAWMTFQHANYTALAKGLPKLIVDAQLVDGTGRDAARSGAYLLAEVYQIASATLRKLGVYELAYLCADRATGVCQRAGDELLAALSTDQVAAALSALGRVRSALELSVSMAEYLAPRHDQDATPQRLSVYGMVLLRGALAAARLGDAVTMRRLLATAQEAAAKVGEGNHYWTSFGPTNVAFYQVAAEIELGEGDRALRTHSGIDPEGYRGMLPERRASHQVDVARACLQTGNLARAGEALVAAKRSAPYELRLRPDAQEMVVELTRRTNGSTTVPGLRELADEIGFSFAAA
jgi:transcriptional regulator with XRE-family HTH domain